jgi:hypothetical protein
MGLLDDLKKEAETLKSQEAVKTQSVKANAAAIDRALRKIFQYMGELFRQLNVVKPPCGFVYDFLTVGKIDGLAQSDYRVEYRTAVRDNTEHYENVFITFKRSKPEQFNVKREADQIERFRDLLWQNNMRFTSEQFRNDRRVITHEIFKINCEIICAADAVGDYEAGVIRFKLKNVEEFGSSAYTLDPESVTDESLEELAKLFIGKESRFKEYNRRPSAIGTATGQFTRSELKIPQYVSAPEPPEEEEKKSKLFGALKSVFKKPNE